MRKCPTCGMDLRVTGRQGVEMDVCPRCRGVWLDKGELDRIIERSTRYRELPADIEEAEGGPAQWTGSRSPQRHDVEDLFEWH